MEEAHIAIIITGILISLVLVFFILKFLKGNIKIKLNKTSFITNDIIEGTFDVVFKQAATINRAYYFLKAELKSKSQGSEGKTNYITLYKFENNFDLGTNINPPFKKSFNLKLKVPSRDINDRDRIYENISNSASSKVVNFIGTNKLINKIIWTVGVYVDCSGIDLSSKKIIKVDTSNGTEDEVEIEVEQNNTDDRNTQNKTIPKIPNPLGGILNP